MTAYYTNDFEFQKIPFIIYWPMLFSTLLISVTSSWEFLWCIVTKSIKSRTSEKFKLF